MSGLFKAGDARMSEAIRPLAQTCHIPPRGTNTSTLPFAEPPNAAETLDRQCIELEATIADLRNRIAEIEEEADRREDAAFERGRQDGLDHAAGEETDRLELLAASLDKLQNNNRKILAECEALAVQLARAALGGIFGDEALHADLVTATLTRHLSSLQRDMVRQLRVSSRDFRSAEELAKLTERFPGISVIYDETLASGECTADLLLGTLDAGLSGQWRRLGQFFDRLTEEEPAP